MCVVKIENKNYEWKYKDSLYEYNDQVRGITDFDLLVLN